jgi:hypothetical protein
MTYEAIVIRDGATKETHMWFASRDKYERFVEHTKERAAKTNYLLEIFVVEHDHEVMLFDYASCCGYYRRAHNFLGRG